MITPNRGPVIANIREACERRDFYAKVEVDDPVQTKEQTKAVLERYLRIRRRPSFFFLNWLAGRTLDLITWYWNRDTKIVGLEHIRGLQGSAIITSNHFNPSENTVIRLLSQKMKKGNLHIVSQDTNLSMTGIFGFYMKYTDIIPISTNRIYMKEHFLPLMEEAVRKRQNILIYPEEEMWFNYRKPRPPKRGAYYYAAVLRLPIVSCFIEIRETNKTDREGFLRTRYILHVLPVIRPDASLPVREDSLRMMEIDYRQKKAAYEKAYGKMLDYDFTPWDIAGWMGDERETEKKGAGR